MKVTTADGLVTLTITASRDELARLMTVVKTVATSDGNEWSYDLFTALAVSGISHDKYKLVTSSGLLVGTYYGLLQVKENT